MALERLAGERDRNSANRQFVYGQLRCLLFPSLTPKLWAIWRGTLGPSGRGEF